MNENLNLVEILKDCPKGTKFYSRCLGSVEFCKITLDNYIEVIDKNGYYIGFKPNGTYQHSEESAEIDLFPTKDQRDWSKWQRPFVDGDIITYMFWHKPTTYIYRENGTHNTSYYVAYSSANNKLYDDGKGALAGNRHDLRFATEEEKQKLFDVLKKEGYEWDAEKKELKHLQQFKDGDIIYNRVQKRICICHHRKDKKLCVSHCRYNVYHKKFELLDTDLVFVKQDYRLATDEEKQILFDTIKENGYKWNAETKTLEKLKKEKFNPKTLKPFESRVLVSTFGPWVPAIFGHYNKDQALPIVVVGGNVYAKCIPYEGNEHLIATFDKPSEFYRYWENY